MFLTIKSSLSWPIICLVSLDEPEEDLTIHVPLVGEVLPRYIRAVMDFICNRIKYQQAFLAPLPGNGC